MSPCSQIEEEIMPGGGFWVQGTGMRSEWLEPKRIRWGGVYLGLTHVVSSRICH